MAVFFTSDHHFGDARRLGFDGRPFADLAEMDRVMAERWNEVVGHADEVWHLGDVTRWTKADRVDALLSSLQGTKHLIAGNNDGPTTLAWPGWASVGPFAEIEAEGARLVLCHYPLRTWNGVGRGAINLHGHSHGRLKPFRRQFDVGVDLREFRPVRLAELVRPPVQLKREART